MSDLRVVADLMAIAARTAPKSAGQDFVVIHTIEGNEVKALADKMYEYGERTGKPGFDRDGQNVADSDTVVLIGINDAQSLGLDCGACGAESCTALVINSHEGEYRGPQCAFAY